MQLLTTALPAAHLSAQMPTGKLAFSTLTPVIILSVLVRMAAPTRKLEYGPMFVFLVCEWQDRPSGGGVCYKKKEGKKEVEKSNLTIVTPDFSKKIQNALSMFSPLAVLPKKKLTVSVFLGINSLLSQFLPLLRHRRRGGG